LLRTLAAIAYLLDAANFHQRPWAVRIYCPANGNFISNMFCEAFLRETLRNQISNW
jgi:hypothetical protein